MSKPKKADKFCSIAKIFSNEHNLIFFKGTPYLFNEGIWREEDKENTIAWISHEYSKAYIEPPMKKDKAEMLSMIQDHTYNQYRKQIKYLSQKQNKKTVNTKDGVLSLKDYTVKPYEMEDFAFHKLPFNYVEEPKCPVMMKFLTTSMGWEWDNEKDEIVMREDEIEDYMKVMHFIQEWMGYSLVPGNPMEKCLIMHGSGRNGKGKLQEIWKYIIGPHNVSSVDIKGINDGSMIFQTKNKLINFSYDLEDGQQLDTGVIKSAISGESMTVNEKYKPQYEMDFTAKLVIACNNLPYIKDTGFAIKERIHFLPFTREFKQEERDIELGDKLKAEAGQIFSWAINGLKRLQRRGHFDVPDRCKKANRSYMKDNDSISNWIEEDKIKQEGSKCKRTDVWKAYKYYCRESNFKPIGKIKFYKQMEKKFFLVKTNGEFFFEGLQIPNQTLSMGGS
jgi:putative DNA primase/helicase